jgi:hypothetical protein
MSWRRRRVGQPAPDLRRVVREHAEVAGHRAGAGDQRGKHRRVGVVDLALREDGTGPHHLVSGRNDRHLQACEAGSLGHADRGQGGKLLRA